MKKVFTHSLLQLQAEWARLLSDPCPRIRLLCRLLHRQVFRVAHHQRRSCQAKERQQ